MSIGQPATKYIPGQARPAIQFLLEVQTEQKNKPHESNIRKRKK